VTLLPHRYNHPIRIAERIATLDILSNGRVNWGSAKSASLTEQGAFQVDRASIHDEWMEALEIIPQMWASETFCYKGRFFDIPPTQIVPKPVQVPHPPMFAACSQPEQAAAVGRMGLGALNLAMYHDELLARRVQEYRAGIAVARPIGRAITNHFTCNPATLVLKDDRKACRYGLTGAMYFNKMLLHYYGAERVMGPANLPTDPVPDGDVDAFMARRNTPRSQLSSIIGDPKAARESVQRFVDVGVDELILVMQTGTTPSEITMESIRTFATDVMPYFS
jgi:alkanesulfonate monooxygenase SsuD/methylene tetrahydromethanopterin reductase-like flavin-dependent oxidoreductase (luciferase family)